MGLLDEFYPLDYSKLKRGQFRRDTPKMREAAANVPVDVARGTVAGALGLPSDTLNFLPAYSPMPMEQFGDYNYAPSQKIPYGSEYFLENLPLAPAADNPLGRVAGQMGALAPMVPVQAARMVGKGAAATARFVAPKVGLLAEDYMRGMGMMPGIVPNEGVGLLGPTMPVKPINPVAEVSPSGFYSAVEQQALNIPRKSGTGASFLNDLMKGQDVKKYEIEAMGLDQFLAGKSNVTRQEVQDFVQSNRINVQEKQLGAGDLASGATQYEKWQLPGGENYREILLTLPQKNKVELDAAQEAAGTLRKQTADLMEQWKNLSEISTPGDTKVSEFYKKVAESRKLRDQAEAKATDLQKQISQETYTPGHFGEPNLLTHLRVNDRIDAEGKKMLLVEEVQSDWHQTGREKGYNTVVRKATQEEKQEWRKLNAIDPNDRTGPMNERLNDLDYLIAGESQGVPDAPFKDTWYQLALKRAIKEAVDKGYDRIGLTTGAQQASRYDLSKQIDKIDYRRSSNNTFELGVVGKNGESVDLPKRFYTAEELPSVLGKEVAEKIIKGEGQRGGGRMTLSGLDLQVGGEGMKKYYDEIYPNFLNKYGKKYGAQVKETQIPTEDNAWNMAEQIKKRGITDAQWRAFSEEDKLKLWNEIKKIEGKKQEPVRYLDITPEMRKAVQKGQPLASAGGINTGLLA